MTLPKTFDPAEAEPRIYAEWEAIGAFRAGANAREGAESFCIVIPPPNVTGSLHMGHALNNTLQDVLIRWKRMQGFDVLWQPGQDHAGIATQMVVERQLVEDGNESRREMGRERFLEKVWAWKGRSGGAITGQLKRLGASCDWSRDRFTMDEGLSRAVLKVFVSLYNDELIYHDKRLVNWDPHFETAISDLEVEQVEVDGHLWRFRYPLADGETCQWPVAFDEDGEATEWETRDYIVVATTRPETMLGDTGVAVHPDDARYAGLVGKEVVLPLVGRRIPIVADEYADPEKGSGAVKITPAHDFNDFEVGRRRDLRAVNVMGPRAQVHLEDNANFLSGVVPEAETMALHGLDRYEARKHVVAMMEARGRLDGIDAERHMVPHGDRSKVAIEPYLTDQWFVDAKRLAGPAIEAVRSGETAILPEANAKTYFHWMENIEPWCISRQLWWGHRIPVWYGPSKGGTLQVEGAHDADTKNKVFCAESQTEAIKVAQKFYGRSVQAVEGLGEAALEGIISSFEADPTRPVPIWRDPDVLDTWFSSALWPFSTLGWPDDTPELARYYKTDVLVTGFDIIFFWVARMMMFGTHFMNEVPFHTVYVHALVRDEKGAKMSKSLGNVIDPLELIDRYGADAVRMTLTSMAAMGRDLKLSVSRVEGHRNFATKLWNAARFAEINDCRPDPEFDPEEVRETVNRWIVGETARARLAMDAALDAYRFNDAANGIYAHVWGVVCDWYVEFAKPLLQAEDSPAKAETRATMAWALDQCLILLHPIMPFVTEALWGQTLGRETMLIHADWPGYGEALADPDADAEIGWIVALIERIRSVRAEMNVAAGARPALHVVEADDAANARLERNAPLIRRLGRIEAIAPGAAGRGAVALPMAGATLALAVAEVIDVAAETKRLEAARAKADREAAKLSAKLGDEAFLAKAPETVVAEQRARLEAAEAESAKLNAALARLSEIA